MGCWEMEVRREPEGAKLGSVANERRGRGKDFRYAFDFESWRAPESDEEEA
jgi:hypothetical protein